MSKKIYSIISIIISIILIFSLKNEVYASSATMSASPTEIEPGKTVTITADIKSAASWVLDISTTGGTLKKNDSRVGNTESGNNENKTITLGTFTADAEGTYKITLSGYVINGDTLSKVNISDEVNIVVEKLPAQDSSTSSTNNNTQTNNSTTTTPEPETPPATATKSSEARLSNFGIKPNDFSGFSKNINQENWSTTVPNEVAEVEVYATPKDSKATVEGTGKVSLKEGDNKISVRVTAEDGKTTKTYNLTIKRKTAAEQEAENGEARLKSLGIKPEKYDFSGFDSEKTEYNVEVPNDVEEIEVCATAMNSGAQITGTGMIELKEGVNKLLIEVIAVNGEKKTYTLTVTREESDETAGTTVEKFGLSTLSIKGLKLSPSFEVGKYEYTATLTEDISTLEIVAKANTEGSKVEIIGNENLQQGENVITILVSNKITEENATYQITVNKNVTIEETVQTSWLKPETWGKEEKIKLLLIAVLIILIISAIILKVKISNEDNKHVVKDLPGADELDRAIAEHQELSEEANYIEEIAKNRFAEQDFEEKPKRKGRHF